MPFGVQLVHNQLIRFHGNNCQMVNQHIIRHFGRHPGFRKFLLFFLFSFLKTSVNCKNKILDAKLKKEPKLHFQQTCCFESKNYFA